MWSKLKSSVAFWFGLSFVLAATVLLPFSVSEKQKHGELLAKGEVTDAAVIDRGKRDADEGSSHWIRLQYYDLALKEYTFQQAIPETLWNQHPIGSTLRVRYLREDPETVTPEALLDDPEWKTLRSLGLTFGIIGVLIVAFSMLKAAQVAPVQTRGANSQEPSK